jgi:hypothetical protein
MNGPKQEKVKKVACRGIKSVTFGDFTFTYKTLEDSQPGTVLFVDCMYKDKIWGYIEFDLLSGKVNLLDEDMVIHDTKSIDII